MIDVKCDSCGDSLATPGGLLFCPPTPNDKSVLKYHICCICYCNLWIKLVNGEFDPKSE
jgi:hypothetical protein